VSALEPVASKKEPQLGLIGSKGDAVPLKAVEVKAKILDMTAEAVVFQEYHNSSKAPIEAKYV
jgi:hypothetical protein